MTWTPFGLSASKWELRRESTSGRKSREAEFRLYDPDYNPVDLSKHGWPI